MNALVRTFDHFLDTDFAGPERDLFWPRSWQTAVSGTVPLDVVENDEDYIVTASVPGLKADEIELTMVNNQLMIKGEMKSDNTIANGRYHRREWRYGRFLRTVTLPGKVKEDDIEAKVQNGVLTVRLPKVTTRKTRRVRIKRNKAGRYHGVVEKIKKILPRF